MGLLMGGIGRLGPLEAEFLRIVPARCDSALCRDYCHS